MKELKILLGVYFLFIFFLIACTKVASTPVIELGEKATATKINSITPPITTGKVTANLSVTPGAKYSLQLINLAGDVKYITGFTADKELVTKELDYSDVKSGDYAVVLIDIFGKEYKSNLTIKK